jgi:hypothetical protein
LSKRGFYKWSDGTPTQYTNFATVTIDGQALNPDIYLQGRCTAINSIHTTSTTTIIGAKTGVPGYWYKADERLALKSSFREQ